MRFLVIVKVAVFFIFILPLIVLAGSYQGKILNIFAYKEKVYIRIANGGWDNAETCTTGNNVFELWLDPREEFGKSLLSLSVVARTTDRVVWVQGAGTCISGPQGAAEKMTALDLKG